MPNFYDLPYPKWNEELKVYYDKIMSENKWPYNTDGTTPKERKLTVEDLARLQELLKKETTPRTYNKVPEYINPIVYKREVKATFVEELTTPIIFDADKIYPQ
jgi:hypothetical protein